jgi:hypothetical protein
MNTSFIKYLPNKSRWISLSLIIYWLLLWIPVSFIMDDVFLYINPIVFFLMLVFLIFNTFYPCILSWYLILALSIAYIIRLVMTLRENYLNHIFREEDLLSFATIGGIISIIIFTGVLALIIRYKPHIKASNNIL